MVLSKTWKKAKIIFEKTNGVSTLGPSVEDYLLTEDTQQQQKYKSMAIKGNIRTVYFFFPFIYVATFQNMY